ncbi:RnfABCDGE type electron transport complex subunit G [Pseudomonas entomophila]|uniref:RnfABCDGE type electron transport complex subunit G n=1 Tax=Pseudomonas entomophila TaxID=312306 RepID=UPI0024071E27|nr:RnfABCDGE type electron transport complex subunit G [Pseudomonas entomophila]MDF9620482.1 RnfABCDGE type electron transport complex subunit G [Pseudomonas entomophila]
MNARARTTLVLIAVAGLSVALSLAWRHWTADSITQAERQLQERQWLAVLPQGSYDNQPLLAPLKLADTTLRHSRLLAGYRATRAGKPAAVVLRSGLQGYGGPIELAIAIDAQGRLIGVRVLHQQESPGLGDQLANPTSHWLDQFVGSRRDAPPEQAWALKRDQGAFDQLAGATVTSRAVIDAIQDALRYVDEHQPLLSSEDRR